MRSLQDAWRDADDPDTKHEVAVALSHALTGYQKAAEANDVSDPEDAILGLREILDINRGRSHAGWKNRAWPDGGLQPIPTTALGAPVCQYPRVPVVS